MLRSYSVDHHMFGTGFGFSLPVGLRSNHISRSGPFGPVRRLRGDRPRGTRIVSSISWYILSEDALRQIGTYHVGIVFCVSELEESLASKIVVVALSGENDTKRHQNKHEKRSNYEPHSFSGDTTA